MRVRSERTNFISRFHHKNGVAEVQTVSAIQVSVIEKNMFPVPWWISHWFHVLSRPTNQILSHDRIPGITPTIKHLLWKSKTDERWEVTSSGLFYYIFFKNLRITKQFPQLFVLNKFNSYFYYLPRHVYVSYLASCYLTWVLGPELRSSEGALNQ